MKQYCQLFFLLFLISFPLSLSAQQNLTASQPFFNKAAHAYQKWLDGCGLGPALHKLLERLGERSGIASLKVEFNKVHGFYIEVTHANVGKIPDDYRRRQTLKNAERYITPELKAFEDKALSANERALALEKQLWEELLGALATHIPQLQKIARAIAELDGIEGAQVHRSWWVARAAVAEATEPKAAAKAPAKRGRKPKAKEETARLKDTR